MSETMTEPKVCPENACRYCGSVSGETPPSAYEMAPLTGDTLRKAIGAACSLVNPRLSEVEWDDVAAALSYITGIDETAACPHPDTKLSSTTDGELIICDCGATWPNTLARLTGARP